VSTFATPYPAVYAGISNLQVYAGNTRARIDVVVTECQYCWGHDGEGNYADNYFSHAMLRTVGIYDSSVGLAEKSSGFLLQNNIFEHLDERMPDHSMISRTLRCIDIDSHREVFSRVVGLLAERGVLKEAAVGYERVDLAGERRAQLLRFPYDTNCKAMSQVPGVWYWLGFSPHSRQYSLF